MAYPHATLFLYGVAHAFALAATGGTAMAHKAWLRARLALVLGTAAAVALLLAAEASAQVTMKIGMVTINDPIHTFATRFGEEIEKRTGGRIKAQGYPAGQNRKLPRPMGAPQVGPPETLVFPPGVPSPANTA